MGLGGGGATAPPAGLSPLQQQQFQQGNQLITQNTPMANVAMQRNLQAQQAVNNFMVNRAKFNDAQMGWNNQQAKWARGGLMMQGLGQVNRALAGPSLAPGMQQRTASRFGVAADPTTQAAMDQQRALTEASTRVGLGNQARFGLAQASRDMRFGGM